MLNVQQLHMLNFKGEFFKVFHYIFNPHVQFTGSLVKATLTGSPRNWSCFALQLLVPDGVYYFVMIIMVIIIMINIA